MSAHLKRFGSEGGLAIQRSIPEIKILTISSIQDCYTVQRYSGITDSAATGTVMIKPSTHSASASLKNQGHIHFGYNPDITTIVYEFDSAYRFYNNTDSANEDLSIGLQKYSISKWTRQGSLCKFDGILSAEEDSTIVYPIKNFAENETVFGGSVEEDTQGGVNLKASAFVAALSSDSSSTTFPNNYIFISQTIDSRVIGDGVSFLRPVINNPAFDITNTSFAFYKTNNYPLIISKKLITLTGSNDIADTQYNSNHLAEIVNSLYYAAAVNSGELNLALGHKLVFIGFKYGFLITAINNITGEFNSSVELYIPAGDNSLLGYLDVAEGESFTGGFLMIDFAVSLHNNFLYAIVENPDNADRHIVVYDISQAQLDQNEDFILENSKSIPNPLSSNLSSVALEKDGNIYFYSNNSTQYIKVSEPDLQVSVDTLLNVTSAFIMQVPVEGSGENITNCSSTIFDFLKYNSNRNEYFSIDNTSTVEQVDQFNSVAWLDLTTDMQLNITPDVPKGQYLPIGDQEKYRLLGDNLLFNINYGESGDFYMPVSSSLEVLHKCIMMVRKNSSMVNGMV